ncbi:two-component sensor histidine kinase [Oxalicibacterium flavum]|uniref:histidine kinase n=1 Tax=Oxalicibacterium flavum TaxID=179467 RepID=A0A8J2UNI7_9BURK|nr:ATP-binding protein [Oxalicibacterium flavum]GGC05805.1 two-component sensor histidine kinase [Oxalicibacterium flavum]
MRLFPRSMAGQLICLLLLGLLLAHAIGVAMRPAGDNLHPLGRRFMLDSLASAYRIATLAPDGSEESLLATLRRDNFALAQEPQSRLPLRAMNEEESRLVKDLQQRIGATPEIRARIRINEAQQPGHQGRLELHVSMALPDGNWINTREVTGEKSPWWRPFWFSIPVSTLPVLVIVFIFVRRILRPIKALADAAERVSRGEHVGPLPVTGPREAREVTTAFNIMQERLRRFIEDRTHMLAAISHDFRTPLTSLRLRTELIDDPELRAAMRRSLDDMSVMAEETLRFSRDDSVNEDTQETDLAALLREVVDDQAVLQHRIALQAPASLPYRCRPLAIKRAITNLVDNAVRYGEHVRIDLGRDEQGQIVIALRDDGPGIPPERIADAFEPFVRLDPARNRDNGGTGLGLTTARSCVEAHGGSLTLANHAQGGLTATIVLPA